MQECPRHVVQVLLLHLQLRQLGGAGQPQLLARAFVQRFQQKLGVDYDRVKYRLGVEIVGLYLLSFLIDIEVFTVEELLLPVLEAAMHITFISRKDTACPDARIARRGHFTHECVEHDRYLGRYDGPDFFLYHIEDLLAQAVTSVTEVVVVIIAAVQTLALELGQEVNDNLCEFGSCDMFECAVTD